MADGYEIGFYIMLAVVGLLILIGIGWAIYVEFGKYAASKLGIDLTAATAAQTTATAEFKTQIRNAVVDFLKETFGGTLDIIGLVAVLMTDFIFLAGPIIDMINQSYKYSIASIVGLLNTAIVGFLGSTPFADFSRMVVGGILPGSDPARGWGGWFIAILSNWKTWIYSIPLLALVFVPTGLLSVSNLASSKTAYGIGLFAIIFYVFMPLAGGGYLGAFSRDTPTFGPDLPVYGPARANPFMPGGSLKFDSPAGYCELPGFGWAQGKVAPASILLSQTILWCHLIEMFNSGNSQVGPTLGMSISLFFAQWWTLYSKGCLDRYYSTGIFAPIVGLILSMAVAGLAYVGLKYTSEGFTSDGSDGGIFHPQQIPSKAKKTDGEKISTKIVVGPPEDTSEPVDDQDAFVCEAYKDGELITSTLVE